ncbi:hypothetical protein SAY87_005098 [Trapa incisa]|uniref:Uncharacterized protein n=1 Tax=Trapa incisa TaxID=236973 RepID=A0AAN7JQS1_9MYRT|nr:hypothetical protein SAY87_005098 [Trapa incisa]
MAHRHGSAAQRIKPSFARFSLSCACFVFQKVRRGWLCSREERKRTSGFRTSLVPDHFNMDAKPSHGGKWKLMGSDEKKAAVDEEMKRMNRLPSNSSYKSHRLRVLNKVLQLMSTQSLVSVSQRTPSQEEELELLFASLSL